MVTVSILVPTYNHEKYIAKCLDSLLMQKTDFQYEILVGEDDSSDRTREICKEYAEKYPEKIRLFLNDRKNVIYLNGRPSGRWNLINLINHASGKYISICEGDDNYIDEHKIQKQVEFMESMPELALSFHPVVWWDINKNKHQIYRPFVRKSIYTLDDLLKNDNFLTICSTMFRADALEQIPDWFKSIPYGDLGLYAIAASKGNIGYIDDVMALYRRHAAGYYSGRHEVHNYMDTIQCWNIISKNLDLEHRESRKKGKKYLHERLHKANERYIQILNHQEDQKDPESKKESLPDVHDPIVLFQQAVEHLNRKNFNKAAKLAGLYRELMDYSIIETVDNRVSDNPRVSVVVVAYNTNQDLIACLNSLLNQKVKKDDYEIIVVDNGKNEEVHEQLMKLPILWVKNPINFILSEGRNIGVHFSKGEIVSFLDDDAIVPDDYISTIMEAFETFDIAALRGKVLPKNENSYRAVSTHYDMGNYPYPHTIDTEGNSAFLRKIYVKCQGMDPLLFGHEGTELSFKINQMLNKNALIYWPRTVIYHDYANTEEKDKTKSARHQLMIDYLNHKDPSILKWASNYNGVYDPQVKVKSQTDVRFRDEIIKQQLIHYILPKIRSTREINRKPLVSVCIPTYNRSEYIIDAIQSVFLNKYNHIEVIVVDDGSTDNTGELIKENFGEKITYIYQENQGAVVARNKLIEVSQGEYICWLDSDDMLIPGVIDQFINLLNQGIEADVFYGDLIHITGDNKYMQVINYPDWYNKNSALIKNMMTSNRIPNPGTIIKKSAYDSIGLYNSKFKRAHDYEWYSRAAFSLKFKHLNYFSAFYRIHDNNLSGNLENKDLSFEAEILKNLVSKTDLRELYKTEIELFSQQGNGLISILLMISKKLLEYKDIAGAKKIMEEAYELEPSKELSQYIQHLSTLREPKQKRKKADDLKISVIIPTYNRPKLLKRAIGSVLNQSYQNFEIIVVNDAGEDSSNIVHSFKDSRIKYYRHESNKGLAGARNTGLAHATGDLIAYLDDDDIFLPHHLEKMVHVFLTKSADVVYSKAVKRIEKEVSGEFDLVRKEEFDNREFDPSLLLVHNYIPVCCIMHKKSCIDKAGVFNEHYRTHEDWDFLIRLSQHYHFHYLPEITCEISWREAGDNMSTNKHFNFLLTLKEIYRETEKRFPLSDIVRFNRFLYKKNRVTQIQTFVHKLFSEYQIGNGSDPNDQIRAIETLLNVYPDSSELHNELAVLHYQINNTASADEHFRKAIELDPENTAPRLNLADLLLSQSKVEEALNLYHEVLKINPLIVDPYMKLAEIGIALKQFEDAHYYLTRAYLLTDQKQRILEYNQLLPDQYQISEDMDAASLIVVTYNSAGTLINNLNSALKHIRPYDEIIVIDNNSSDDTVKILEEFSSKSNQIKIILNEENLGFTRATNQGIEASKNPYVVLLNPDTVVTERWLEKLIAKTVVQDVAAVGPVSNYAAGFQNMRSYYRPEKEKEIQLEKLADLFEKTYANEYVESPLVIGFCLLLKRDALDKIGLLDEQLFLGNDDLELSWRMRLKGYKLAVAPDTFIFHDGHHSFKQDKTSRSEQLVQESTNMLYKKLQRYYGDDRVPRPEEIWSINWFTPENATFNPNVRWNEVRKLPGDPAKETPYDQSTGPNPGKIRKPVYKKNSGKPGLTSIVMLTYNQLEYTQKCIESLYLYTDVPFELIIVDNKSTDGTVAWLNELAKQKDNVKLILNKTNKGFPGGCNQGIKTATGDYVLLLNNDVIVTPGWLSGLIDAFHRDPELGIVGPMTNNISGPQKDTDAAYATIDEMFQYASSVAERHRGELMYFPRIVGFAMLIRKEVIDSIGLLEEAFGSGNYEDDDFCLRAELAGYKAAIVKDVFIHHFGSVSFTSEGKQKYVEKLQSNSEKFYEKWKDLDQPSLLWSIFMFNKAKEEKEKGNIPLAIELYEKVFAQRPEEKVLVEEYTELLLQEGKADEALKKISVYLQHQPNDHEAWNFAGQLHLQSGNPEEAYNSFKQAVICAPSNRDYLHNMIDLAIMMQDFETALHTLQSLLAIAPDDVDAALKMSHLLVEAGKVQEAQEILTGSLQRVPGNEKLQFYLKKTSQPELYLTYAFIDNNQLDLAFDAVERYLQKNPDDPEALALKGSILFYHEQYKEAEAIYDRLLEVNPGNQEALFYKFKILIINRDSKLIDEFVAHNKTTIEENSSLAREYIMYLLNLEDFEGALSEIDAYIGNFNEDYFGYWVMAELYREMGETEKALNFYNVALEKGVETEEQVKAIRDFVEQMEVQRA